MGKSLHQGSIGWRSCEKVFESGSMGVTLKGRVGNLVKVKWSKSATLKFIYWKLKYAKLYAKGHLEVGG